MESKRILLVIPAQGGSRTLGENAAFALTQNGNAVTVFDIGRYKTFYQKQLVPTSDFSLELVNQSLISKALEIRAELVLVLALAPVTTYTLQLLRTAGIKTAHYFCEDLRADEHWKPVIAAYDAFFIIQKGNWLADCKKLNPSSYYLPNGAPVEKMPLSPEPKEMDLVFAGAPYENRIRFFERVLRTNIDFKIYGWGWDRVNLSPELRARVIGGSEWLSTETLFDLYAKARIVLNLHSTLNGQEVDPLGDFVNPRAFTIPLAHSLQLADRREALSEFFTEGMDIALFASMDELVEKVQYYLMHPEAAATVIESSRATVLSCHLLTHRMEAMLQTIFAPKKKSPDELLHRTKERIRNGEPLTDNDFILLLAEDIRVRRSSAEDA